MKLKQFALKGLVTLAVVVALCMFFSGTVKTITTPKIKMVATKEGKLEQTAQLNAKLVFAESEPFRIEEAMEATVLVERVFVRPGYGVKKGDIILIRKYSLKELSRIGISFHHEAVSLSPISARV